MYRSSVLQFNAGLRQKIQPISFDQTMAESRITEVLAEWEFVSMRVAPIGSIVNPFYDSLLVKVTTRRSNLNEAAGRMERCLQEFRIRGVKTNIPFFISLITHPTFLAGDATDQNDRQDA